MKSLWTQERPPRRPESRAAIGPRTRRFLLGSTVTKELTNTFACRRTRYSNRVYIKRRRLKVNRYRNKIRQALRPALAQTARTSPPTTPRRRRGRPRPRPGDYFSKKWPFGTQGPPAAAHAHKNTAPPLAPPENNTLAAQVTCSYESTQNKFPECPVGPTADGRPSVACVRYPHFASSTAPEQPTPASLRCRPDHLATRATSWHRSARLEAPGASKIAALAVSSLSPGLDVLDVKLDVKLDATLDAPRRILDAHTVTPCSSCV